MNNPGAALEEMRRALDELGASAEVRDRIFSWTFERVFAA